MRSRSFLLAFAAGCVGVHANPHPPGGTGSGGSGSGSGSGTGLGDPVTIDSNKGACADPEGPLHGYSLASEVETLIVGKWRQCSGPAVFNRTYDGIEADADGSFYFLDDNGTTLVRRTGFDSQGTWTAGQEGPHSVQLDFHLVDTGDGGYPQFEDSPRRLAMRIGYNDEATILAIEP